MLLKRRRWNGWIPVSIARHQRIIDSTNATHNRNVTALPCVDLTPTGLGGHDMRHTSNDKRHEHIIVVASCGLNKKNLESMFFSVLVNKMGPVKGP